MKKNLFVLGFAVVLGFAFQSCENVDEPETPALDSSEEHVAVDLGLSVKWATCNIGSTKPEEYGDYFAWGEILPGLDFSVSNYQASDDDAARANWGGDWRMPTKDEFDELLNSDNCSWTWTTLGDVSGWKVVSRKPGHEGNSIFLPAAGIRINRDLYYAGSRGYYWSGSLYTDDTDDAWRLFSLSNNRTMTHSGRDSGLPVRPVRPSSAEDR